MLSVMAGRPELATVTPPAGPLRIGLALGVPTPLARLDPEFRAAAERTARALAAAGHEVVELVARPAAGGAGEALLLAVAAELEHRTPWMRVAGTPGTAPVRERAENLPE